LPFASEDNAVFLKTIVVELTETILDPETVRTAVSGSLSSATTTVVFPVSAQDASYAENLPSSS
jgi:hypothetical protein